jgi:hypothetical protein
MGVHANKVVCTLSDERAAFRPQWS